jgi:hypothetical protein
VSSGSQERLTPIVRRVATRDRFEQSCLLDRQRRAVVLAIVLLGLALFGWRPAGATPPTGSLDRPTPIPFTAQRPGNPADGYRALTSREWVGCGVPALYYDLLKAALPDRWLPKIATLPGRASGQEGLPYFLNRFTTKGGVEVLAPNCLICHAGRINGDLVVGLGNSDGRYQPFGPEISKLTRWVQWGSWLYFWSPSRRAEMAKVGDRMAAVAPYMTVPVVGSNPANNLAWALVRHHDPQTLAWSDQANLPPPPVDAPPADVPPWWRMRKKNAMFATGAGRGDLTRLMAINATLCVDTVEDFDAFYDYFDDIRAFVASIEAPPYPYPINARRAQKGHLVFERRCQGCHGTYGQGATYPNLLLPLAMVGTDPALAEYHVVTSAPAGEWLNGSVFTANQARYDPSLGYVAPPLDGIWVTAPFLHNGSVPTLAALLDSATRPKYWTRPIDPETGAYDTRRYDPDAVGWQFERLDHGQADTDGDRRRRIVDTTVAGFGNGGHTYGDRLSPEKRAAVLEYLKTL